MQGMKVTVNDITLSKTGPHCLVVKHYFAEFVDRNKIRMFKKQYLLCMMALL